MVPLIFGNSHIEAPMLGIPRSIILPINCKRLVNPGRNSQELGTRTVVVHVKTWGG